MIRYTLENYNKTRVWQRYSQLVIQRIACMQGTLYLCSYSSCPNFCFSIHIYNSTIWRYNKQYKQLFSHVLSSIFYFIYLVGFLVVCFISFSLFCCVCYGIETQIIILLPQEEKSSDDGGRLINTYWFHLVLLSNRNATIHIRT